MNRNVISVSELNNYIKRLLENDQFLKNIYVRGEISNYKYHSSGHMYFSLKDADSKIKCIMFRSYNSTLKFRPEDGMNVILRGSISLYERDGQYQFYCNKMEPDGIGSLYLAYEQLKEKLKLEGLFENDLKKRIPEVPTRIGVATSPTGSVIKDIINVATSRYNKVNILLYPVKVQGEGAAESIIEGIEYFNSREDIDVIILGRGGGSIEELWAFNSENLAYAIRNSKIPVVSAVGHETDFTISDFAADLRASTPSHAAELCTPSYNILKFRIGSQKNILEKEIDNFIKSARHRVEIERNNIERYSPRNRIENQIQYLDNLYNKLIYNIDYIVRTKKNSLMLQVNKIDGLSPMKILTRGYAFVERDSKVITSVKVLNENDKIKLRMHDGHAECEVRYIKENELW